MKIVSAKDVVIGEGLPKICVPLMPVDVDDLEEAAKIAIASECDMIEWRLDYLGLWNEVDNVNKAGMHIVEINRGLEIIRRVTDMPVILTLRTRGEGGAANIPRREYYVKIRDIIEECDPDIIDIEAFGPDSDEGFDPVEFIVGMARENDIAVILSNHDFGKTPPVEEMVKRICVMDQMGADIPKVAYMPRSEEDVLAVIQAAQTAAEYCDKPFIALSMGEEGKPTRICSGNSGSAITFASAVEQSAPGQAGVAELIEHLKRFYNS